MTIPIQIELKKKSKVLELTWGDGEAMCISCAELRRFCACASCRARNIVGTLLVNESPDVDKVVMMGSVGLQIGFADGHDRGVFPWAYLRAIYQGRAAEHLRDR